jgi:hypothetical protein
VLVVAGVAALVTEAFWGAARKAPVSSSRLSRSYLRRLRPGSAPSPLACEKHQLPLFTVGGGDIEAYARTFEEGGRVGATVARRQLGRPLA